MSCNVCRSRCSAFKCWLNCWVVLWIACRHCAWCSRVEFKRDEDPGSGWWTSAPCLDGFFGWIKGRMKVPSMMGCVIGGAWDGLIGGGITRNIWTRETHCSRIEPQNVWVRGRLIVNEENWCKRVERPQRESAVIACGGTTNRWEGRDVPWIVFSWRRLYQKKTIFRVEISGLRLYCKCWFKQGRFVLRARLVKYSRRCCHPKGDWSKWNLW